MAFAAHQLPAAEAASHGITLEVIKPPEVRKALSYCPAGGSSNAVLRGQAGSGAWPAITNGCPKKWQARTSSPLPVRWSIDYSPSPLKFHNSITPSRRISGVAHSTESLPWLLL